MQPNKQKKGQKKNKRLEAYARYSGMAFQMMLVIGLGVFSGLKLDEWLQWKVPVFTILLSLAGVALAIYQVIKDVMK